MLQCETVYDRYLRENEREKRKQQELRVFSVERNYGDFGCLQTQRIVPALGGGAELNRSHEANFRYRTTIYADPTSICSLN
jgi:hypothetical protein